MLNTVQAFTRKSILEGLKKLPQSNQEFFVRIFSHKDRSKTIEEVVESLEEDKLESALGLIERTLRR